MHKDIMGLLRRLGLKDREGRIYLACLRRKEGLFLFEVAQETRIVRSTAELTVKRLVAGGFLHKARVGRRLRYFAQAPEALLFRQKQLAEDLEQVVPMLSKIGGERKEMDIMYFEGVMGFRQALEDVLLQTKFAPKAKRDILAFASGEDSKRLFPNMQKLFINKRIRNGVWYKVIAPRSSAQVREYTDDAKALRAARYMPESAYPFHIEAAIYADNVMIYSSTHPVGGVIIRNEKVADSMRALFYMVWGFLSAGRDENR